MTPFVVFAVVAPWVVEEEVVVWLVVVVVIVVVFSPRHPQLIAAQVRPNETVV